MVYAYRSKIHLAEVALNVRDLARQTAFYTQVLGLEILSQTDWEVILGAGGKALVHLIQTNREETVKSSYGLYHMAILLPSREDGRIIGVTEELSAQEIYEMGRQVDPFVIASDTRMGHIHLSVKDSKEASSFYQTVLDLDDKFTIPSASWIASGDYHHHLAVNEWGGKHLANREKELPGLAYYVVEVASKDDLVAIAERAKGNGAPVSWMTSSELTFQDPDGIVTRVRKG